MERRRIEKDEAIVVVVVDEDPMNNWQKVFSSLKHVVGVGVVRVEHISFACVTSCVVRDDGGVVMEVEPLAGAPFGSSASRARTIRNPHAVLVRSFARGPKQEHFEHYLHAFNIAQVPCCNGVRSLLELTERASCIALAKRVEKITKKELRLVPLEMHPNVKERVQPVGKNFLYPQVVKIGSCHAGRGKILLHNAQEGDDVLGTLETLTKHYFTVEPFISVSYEYRLYKMGKHLRCYRRFRATQEEEGEEGGKKKKSHDDETRATSGSVSWKANVGPSEVEELPVTDRHKRIAAALDSCFDDFLIWSVDVVVDQQGQEWCLEVNDSSTGFVPMWKEQDMLAIAEAVLQIVQREFEIQP